MEPQVPEVDSLGASISTAFPKLLQHEQVDNAEIPVKETMLNLTSDTVGQRKGKNGAEKLAIITSKG